MLEKTVLQFIKSNEWPANFYIRGYILANVNFKNAVHSIDAWDIWSESGQTLHNFWDEISMDIMSIVHNAFISRKK